MCMIDPNKTQTKKKERKSKPRLVLWVAWQLARWRDISQTRENGVEYQFRAKEVHLEKKRRKGKKKFKKRGKVRT